MTSPPLALHALGGKEPPPEIVADLGRLHHMPPEAIAKLWQVLEPCLTGPITKETERLLDVFCSAYRVSSDDLGRVLKACRFLITGAVKHDLPPDLLADDLDRLCPESPLARELLLAGYEPVKRQIREGLQKAALFDYGNVLVGVQWRLDMIDSTEQGSKLVLPVALLCLHYQSGLERERITLQVVPEMMAELKAACEQILAR